MPLGDVLGDLAVVQRCQLHKLRNVRDHLPKNAQAYVIGAMRELLGSGAILNNGALIFDRSNDLLLTNLISGTGSLTQNGGNTLFVSNVNTYGGGTWITGSGTLSVRNSNALGSGDLDAAIADSMMRDGGLKIPSAASKLRPRHGMKRAVDTKN